MCKRAANFNLITTLVLLDNFDMENARLVQAFAEEQALEDAIYYLGEALRKSVIDLEVFLKKVRELSRKQFMKRALIRKCREKAGLPALA